MAFLGFFFGIGSGLFVAFAGTVFDMQAMGSSGVTMFWLSFLILILGFLAWIPKTWVRIGCGCALVFLAGYGLVTNGLYFILAGAFTLIAGVLTFTLRVPKPVAA